MQTTRRGFIDVVLGACGLSALLSACGGGSSGGDGSACTPMGTIVGNHVPGHVLNVPAADVAAGVERTYDIMGGATHNHQVTVTAAMFATIAAGAEARTSSTAGSADGHNHSVFIRC